jgi:ribonuclease Z
MKTSDSQLKRKREDSPELPAKRPALMTQGSESTGHKSLKDVTEEPAFELQNIAGESAQEWRRLMIDTMFPGSRQRQKKGKERAGNAPQPKKSNGKGEDRVPQSNPTPTAMDSATTHQTPPTTVDSNAAPKNHTSRSATSPNVRDRHG